VRGASGTVAGKQEALRNAGVTVLESPIHVAEWARKYNLK
jgi:succinyl-CoA synthetase alpha subunit